MRQFFSKIHYVPGFSGPARVNRMTGELQLNPDVWPKLTDAEKDFIMAHELGHLLLNTTSETEADAFADYLYANKGLSLKQSISSMTKFLDESNPQHRERVHLQLIRVFERDAINGNLKAKEILQQLQSNKMTNTNLMMARMQGMEVTDDFLGIAIGKKAKARKAQKQADKSERKQARSELIRSKAYAARTYADQGIVVPKGNFGDTAVGKVLGGIAGVAGRLTGINLTPMQQELAPETTPDMEAANFQQQNTQAAQPRQKSNAGTYILVAVVVVVVVFVAIKLLKKKN